MPMHANAVPMQVISPVLGVQQPHSRDGAEVLIDVQHGDHRDLGGQGVDLHLEALDHVVLYCGGGAGCAVHFVHEGLPRGEHAPKLQVTQTDRLLNLLRNKECFRKQCFTECAYISCVHGSLPCGKHAKRAAGRGGHLHI